MVSTATVTRKSGPLFKPARIARDYAYVMPGFFISLFAFVLLVPLAILSTATMIIWVGALLLPYTLRLATGFAELSRARLRHRGTDVPPVRYASVRPGFSGIFDRMAEPRRWLDLVFETLIAFPLRTFTFVVASAWTVTAIAGVTHVVWGIFLPRDENSLAALVLEGITGGAAPDAITHSFFVDTGFNFIVGCLFLATLPLVLRGLAQLDASVTAAALGGAVGMPAADVPPAERPDVESPGATRRSAAFGASLSGGSWSWIAASFVAVVSVAVGWPVLAGLYGVPVVLAMLISLAQASALLLVVRWPAAGIALQAAAAAASALATSDTFGWPWPWPAMALILQGALTLLVALRNTWPWAGVAWLVPQLAVLLAVFPSGITPGARNSLVVSSAVSLGLLFIGIIIRQLVTSRGDLQAERLTSAELDAQRRELSERNRIAQELHDVVAHSMSVISVQATTAKYRLPGLDPAVEREFQSIAGSSRQALSEMRSLLALLRSSVEDREVLLTPQPTIADIPSLVEDSRRSGARISLSMGRPDDSPPSVHEEVSAATSLTAYRIVQEALSNAMRHSPGAEIVVVVENDHGIAVDIGNGPSDGGGNHPPAPGAGWGLVGVRERVHALGGSVEAGPTGSGGFRVRAVLPLGTA